MKLTPTSRPELPLLLAFGAHPDDIEFGCGGVIARETQTGRPAHVVVCSRGEAATHGTPEQREEEAGRAAALLGATLEFVDLGGDARMEATVGRRLALAAIIRRVRPGIVLAPVPVENQHPDHAVVGRLVRDAARLARYGGVEPLRPAGEPHAIEHLLFYAITAETEACGLAPVLIDVSAPPVMSAWKAAMEAHASQMKTRNYVELQLARARVHGLRAGVEHAIALFPSDPLVIDSLSQLGKSARRF
ncbi:MAG TPA: PIG-L family deacetylase [Opitutaceae bacterium]